MPWDLCCLQHSLIVLLDVYQEARFGKLPLVDGKRNREESALILFPQSPKYSTSKVVYSLVIFYQFDTVSKQDSTSRDRPRKDCFTHRIFIASSFCSLFLSYLDKIIIQTLNIDSKHATGKVQRRAGSSAMHERSFATVCSLSYALAPRRNSRILHVHIRAD